MKRITRHPAITGFIVLVMVLASPATAGTVVKTIQNGDTVYAGEVNLDFATNFPDATCLIHYSNYNRNLVDNRIDISASTGAFGLHAGDVGGITGLYYFAGATGHLTGNPGIEIRTPAEPLKSPVDDHTDPAEGTCMALTDAVAASPGITSSSDSVIHGHSFAATITGESNHRYFIYIKAIGGVSAGEYPWIPAGQPGVAVGADPPKTVSNATATSQADITTTGPGAYTVQFGTGYSTQTQTYIIEVIDTVDTGRSGNVQVKVETGEVTISAAGTGTYYIGEEIVLSGTNTDSNTVYLYIVGQNLGNGNGVKLDDFPVEVVNNTPATMKQVGVYADDTWEHRWSTRPADIGNVVPDSGSYTIYAVSRPCARDCLSNVEYSTASISLQASSVTACLSNTNLARGNSQTITGTATGDPDYIYIWIFGKNHLSPFGEAMAVETDGTFAYTLDDTDDLASGIYHVIVQHPMMDGIQSPFSNPGTYTITMSDGRVVNLGILLAEAAATALTDAMDSGNTDDEYVKLTFNVETPWIIINQIHDQATGSTFTISGTTNLAAGSNLLFSAISASFEPWNKTQAGQFAGTSGLVTVVTGSPCNTWSFEVDATDFPPDRYIVNIESVETGTTQTSSFNITPASSDPGSGITLFSGWNFISTPRRLSAGNNTAAIFQHVDTCGHSIFAYDAGSGAWRTMAAADEIRPLDGIWIYANGTASVQFKYDSGAVQTPPVKSLFLGWNAIGFSGLEPASARDALYSARTGWANLIGWSAEAQQYETAIVNGGSGAFNDTRMMRPGQGYWLYMTERGNLSGLSP